MCPGASGSLWLPHSRHRHRTAPSSRRSCSRATSSIIFRHRRPHGRSRPPSSRCRESRRRREKPAAQLPGDALLAEPAVDGMWSPGCQPTLLQTEATHSCGRGETRMVGTQTELTFTFQTVHVIKTSDMPLPGTLACNFEGVPQKNKGVSWDRAGHGRLGRGQARGQVPGQPPQWTSRRTGDPRSRKAGLRGILSGRTQ